MRRVNSLAEESLDAHLNGALLAHRNTRKGRVSNCKVSHRPARNINSQIYMLSGEQILIFVLQRLLSVLETQSKGTQPLILTDLLTSTRSPEWLASHHGRAITPVGAYKQN